MEKFDKANYFYFIPPEAEGKSQSSVEYMDIPELESSPIRTEWLESNNKSELLNKYYKNYVQPFKEKGTEKEFCASIEDPVRKQRIFPGYQFRSVIANQRTWNVKYPRERFPLDHKIYDQFLDSFSIGSITDFNPEDYGLVSSDVSTTKSTVSETTDHQLINGSERSHEKKKKKKHKHDSEHKEKKQKHKREKEHKKDKDGEHKKKKRKKKEEKHYWMVFAAIILN
ncbi:13247_t:CDS:2 [Cetraspora pellucida]|uniref:13247_t:CDS:1 n=1 Tax=Cetraspora pellucida TaxID=1433469 RepID=A0ACA9JX21_9GLOM|nr:13247_t:CDS:2 [Cetraspora pellucida]